MNLFLAFASQAVRYVIVPLLIFLAALVLNKNDFASLIVAYSLSMIVMALVDYGLPLRLMTTIPKQNFIGMSTLSSHMLIKLSMAFFALLFSLAYSEFSGLSSDVILIFAISGVLLSFQNYFSALFRSFNNYKTEVISQILFVLTVIVVILICSDYFDLLNAIAASVFIGRAIALLFCIIFFKRNSSKYCEKYSSSKEFPWRSLKAEALSSFPLFLLAVIATVIVNLDSMIAIKYVSSSEIANYQMFFRLMMLSMIIPEALNAFYLPRSTKVLESSKHKYQGFIHALFYKYMVLAILSSLVYFFCAEWFVGLAFDMKYTVDGLVVIGLSLILFLRVFGGFLTTVLLNYECLWYRVSGLTLASVVGTIFLLAMVDDIKIYAVLYSAILVHIILNLFYFIKVFSLLRGKYEHPN